MYVRAGRSAFARPCVGVQVYLNYLQLFLKECPGKRKWVIDKTHKTNPGIKEDVEEYSYRRNKNIIGIKENRRGMICWNEF